MMKKAPFELVLGYVPKIHQSVRPFKSLSAEVWLQRLKQAHEEAKEALRKAADLVLSTCFEPYQKGDKVWLEGRNLTSSFLSNHHHLPVVV